MKYLKIEKGKGLFRKQSGNYSDIDQMGKDDILYLLDIATNESEKFEIDDMSKLEIANPAHKIIYQNLSEKFQELLDNKTRFLDESESLYREAMQKYQV